jgi:hypothetical protein
MRFILKYEGPLPSNGSPKVKHRIRQQLHPQLKELWGAEEALTAVKKPKHVRRAGFDFVPAVTEELDLVCHLTVAILQRGTPGHIMKKHGGDIDNRLKTLFDSLAVPPVGQLVGLGGPTPEEEPFYCLLEDDLRITRIDVRTEHLLTPGPPGQVLVVITAVVRPTKVNMDNLEFLGGWLQ